MNDASSVIRPLLDATYLASAVLFIIGLRQLTRVRTARRGNALAAAGMLLAVVATMLDIGWVDYRWIAAGIVVGSLIGATLATRVAMTSMPELVAVLNGFGGAASALVALAVVWSQVIEPSASGTLPSVLGSAARSGGAVALTIVVSIFIGGVTLSGSLVAFAKLSEWLPGEPWLYRGRHAVLAALAALALVVGGYFGFVADDGGLVGSVCALSAIALVLGVLLVMPIGGADMPVVISLLNSYSGLAAAATGFALANNLLIISGALVGAAGLILTNIMCRAMNRSLVNVVFGGFGAVVEGGDSQASEYQNVRSCGVDELAMMLEDARRVVMVPGYGLAVAQAQHAARDLASLLEGSGIDVRYAIHPVAGRMPGHMNVLLAEADVPYEQLIEMDVINPEFKKTDVVLVLGANDIVNPAALRDERSPIYGMPILEVFRARSVFVIKRSLGAGFANVKNDLFEADNTVMVYGDAKHVLQGLVAALKETMQDTAA